MAFYFISSTFEDVEKKTTEIYRFQKYLLVNEYANTTNLPTSMNLPENIINYCKYIFSITTPETGNENIQPMNDKLRKREKEISVELFKMRKLAEKEKVDARLKLLYKK